MERGIIAHPPGTYYIELREDYVQLCFGLPKRPRSASSAHCMALILSVLERRTNHRLSKQHSPVIVMSKAQWMDALYGVFSQRCIQASIEELGDASLVWKVPYQGRETYQLNCDEVNHRLATLPAIERKEQSQQVACYATYSEYLHSPEWQAHKQRALKTAGNRCQVCNTQRGLNVHHRTYERIGREQARDVIVLCRACHETFHTTGKLAREQEGAL